MCDSLQFCTDMKYYISFIGYGGDWLEEIIHLNGVHEVQYLLPVILLLAACKDRRSKQQCSGIET